MSDKFDYKYTAPTAEERKEIDSIRRQYKAEERQVSKIERLRKLDKKVRFLPKAVSITIGVLGCLIFGGGMALFLEANVIVWGIVLGVLGCGVMGVAYPSHKILLKKNKDKYAEEILSLSDELLNN